MTSKISVKIAMEWVPVGEALPGEDLEDGRGFRPVLVADDMGGVYPARFREVAPPGCHWLSPTGYLEAITHWMPMPPPPKVLEGGR